MQSKATNVEDYLAELPADRRAAISAVRKVILDNLDGEFQEGMQYGMISYFVPHSIYPPGYHCDPRQPLPYACLASQKNYMSLYMMTVYGHAGEDTWFRDAWEKTGKKLDMGKSCIRFKTLDDLPLEIVGQAIGRVSLKKYIAHYERIRQEYQDQTPAEKAKARRASAAKNSRKKPVKKPPRKAVKAKKPARKR